MAYFGRAHSGYCRQQTALARPGHPGLADTRQIIQGQYQAQRASGPRIVSTGLSPAPSTLLAGCPLAHSATLKLPGVQPSRHLVLQQNAGALVGRSGQYAQQQVQAGIGQLAKHAR
jgi:hypothetical protein